jgi:hypothetical protein
MTSIPVSLYNSMFEFFGAAICGVITYIIIKDLYKELRRNKKK